MGYSWTEYLGYRLTNQHFIYIDKDNKDTKFTYNETENQTSIYLLQVVSELFRGFKEIFLVAILVIALIFIFANWGVHLFGMRFAACNDLSITNRSECSGVYLAKVFVTTMNLPIREGQRYPALIAPRQGQCKFTMQISALPI